MARNQLPEGVGKKIVEALKRQSEADITPVVSVDSSLNSNIQQNEEQDITDTNFDNVSETNFSALNESMIVEDENNSATAFDLRKIQKDNIVTPLKETVPETPLFKAGSETTTITFNNQNSANTQYVSGIPIMDEQKKQPLPAMVTISIPTNVAVLKNLIAALPVGVTKQTGAQIIRQTLEAMGLPMASVLKEAQEVQEELNTNTRECMLKIQEFKTNIMQLEQSVQEYQKNITQINDLVSLFLLTDRK